MNANCSSTWKAKVTCLSDMTDEEVRTTHLGLVAPPPREEMERDTQKAERELLAPLRLGQRNIQASVDLTTMGRVTPARQQGQCGSCAAFAAVTTMESCMHKATGVLPSDLSEQHILDCAYGWHTAIRGCQGAWPLFYQQWMHQAHNGDLADEAQYPYRAQVGNCQNSSMGSTNHGARVTSSQASWYSS